MSRDRNSVQRTAGQPASSSSQEASRGGFAPDNPAMLAQRKQIESSFGSAAQLAAAPEEELQMKAPDEELQMKAPEEELPAQGKRAG